MGDYRPPPVSMGNVFYDEIELPDTDRCWLFQRLHTYKEWIVDFCVELRLEGADGKHFPIERVDCCHGEIHRHHFPANGPERSDSLVDLHTGMRQQVTEEYYRAYDDIVDNSAYKVRQWRHGQV